MTIGLKPRSVLGVLSTLILVGCSASASPLKTPLTSLANIQLPAPPPEAGSASLDLLTVDSRNGLLYVPYTSTLDIVDTRARKLKGQVANLPGIKSIALTPDPNIIFTADGGNNHVAVIDVAKLQAIDEIKTPLGNPDAMVYDPSNDAMVVGQTGPSPNLAFIDRTSHKLLGSLVLTSSPELMAVDPHAGRVFLAMHDQNAVIIVDVASRQITETYKGCDIKSPVGMAFDPDQGRLFVANGVLHTNNVVSVIDVVLDRCLGSIDIGHGPDQAAFNEHLHHLYVANSGTSNLSVIDTVSLKPLGVNGTGHAAHSVTVDPMTDLVYVGVERAGIIGVYHDP
jgi:DNA-binding beta-propeller fold protein YncE